MGTFARLAAGKTTSPFKSSREAESSCDSSRLALNAKQATRPPRPFKISSKSVFILLNHPFGAQLCTPRRARGAALHSRSNALILLNHPLDAQNDRTETRV